MLKSKNFTLAIMIFSLVLFIGGVFVLAAPMPTIQSRVTHPGFVRGHNGILNGLNTFAYGYGYGYYDGWGYGYGYGSNSIYIVVHNKVVYGFFGADGAPTIDSVSSTSTTFTVNFTTPYKTLDVALDYSTVADYNLSQITDTVTEGSENIGSRSLTVTGLTCGTLYYYQVTATDIHPNYWNTSTYTVTTSACATTTTSDPGMTVLIPLASNPSNPGSNPSNNNYENNNQKNAYQFPRNLRQGINGDDVLNLQRFMNNHNTIVSTTGFGAPGNETVHYGPATKNAVARFQRANATDMNLTSRDLSLGSGLFGPKTRAYVNTMLRNGR